MKYIKFSYKSEDKTDVILEFRICCQHLSFMYEYFFTPIKTDSITGINIIFHSDEIQYEQEVMLTALVIYVYVNLETLQKMSRLEKLQYFFDLSQTKILSYAEKCNWNTSPFRAAYDTIIENQFLFREHWKKSVSSPNKQLKAWIYFEHDYMSSGTFVDFTNRNNHLIKRVQFTPSGYSVLCDSVGLIKWINDTSVKIYYIYVSRAGRAAETNTRDYWLINIDGTVRFENPKANDLDPHAMYRLGTMLTGGNIILPDKERGMNLIKRAAELGYSHAKKKL